MLYAKCHYASSNVEREKERERECRTKITKQKQNNKRGKYQKHTRTNTKQDSWRKQVRCELMDAKGEWMLPRGSIRDEGLSPARRDSKWAAVAPWSPENSTSHSCAQDTQRGPRAQAERCAFLSPMNVHTNHDEGERAGRTQRDCVWLPSGKCQMCITSVEHGKNTGEPEIHVKYLQAWGTA